MPALSNPRYERFAQAVAKGKSNGDAYIYAGYAPCKRDNSNRSNASKLAHKPEIADRIAELQAKQAKRLNIGVDDLIRELDEMIYLAKRNKQVSGGVGAILAKGKLLGLVVDRVESEVVRKPSREPTKERRMSLEEWREKFAPPGSDTVQ